MHAKSKSSTCIHLSCVIISSLLEFYRSQSLLQFVIPFVSVFSIPQQIFLRTLLL